MLSRTISPFHFLAPLPALRATMPRLGCLLVLASGLACAQEEPLETHPPRGLLPTSEQFLSDLESVNAVTGTLSLHIPLASLPPGRGGMGFDLQMVYNSAIYDIQPDRVADPKMGRRLQNARTGGWHYNFENFGLTLETRVSATSSWNCEDDDHDYAKRLYRLRVGLGDGSEHVLQLRGYGDEIEDNYVEHDGYYAISPNGTRSACAKTSSLYPKDLTGQRLTYYTSDGTYLKLEIDPTKSDPGNPGWPWILYFPDGRRMGGLSDTLEWLSDANGNRVTIQSLCHDDDCDQPYTEIKDDLGRSIMVDKPTNSPTDTITAPNGAYWEVTKGSVTIGNTTTPCPQGSWCPTYNIAPSITEHLYNVVSVVTSIAVPSSPNRTSYSFGYSDNAGKGWGELNSITTPLGGNAVYHYAQDNHSRTYNDLLLNPVLSKTVTHDGTTDPQSTFQYSEWSSVDQRFIAKCSIGDAISVFTSPDSGTTTHCFYDPSVLSSWRRGLVHRVEGPGGDIRERVWAQNVPAGQNTNKQDPGNPVVQASINSLSNGSTATKSAIVDFEYDKNGNVTHKTEYDWVPYGITTGSAVLRDTLLTYWVDLSTSLDSAYWNPHNSDIDSWTDPDAPRRLNALRRSNISGASITEITYDDAYGKGNPKDTLRWQSSLPATAPELGKLTASNSVVTSRSYDDYGNLLGLSGAQVPVTYAYDGESLYPTQMTQGSGAEKRTFALDYDRDTGWLRSRKDIDNASFETSYGYDGLGRQKLVDEGGLRQSATTYDDVNRKITQKSDLRAHADGLLQTVTHYDQLGRVRLTRQSDGAVLGENTETDGIKVKSLYDVFAGGRNRIVSNPYSSSTEKTMGWTCTQTDLSGRVQYISTFSGTAAPDSCTATGNATGSSHMVYSANQTTVTDASGAQKTTATDALGRLTSVTEYTGYTAPASYTTTYGYDVTGNLGTVFQGTQTRTFDYNSIGRLKSASNPESGTISYEYYADGTVHLRTDGHGTTTYAYDSLQRLKTKSYNDGSTNRVTYDYYVPADGAPLVGHLKSVTTDDGHRTSYVYDALGRVTSSTQTVGGVNKDYPLAYTYLLNGELASITYPSARTVSYTADDAGRVTGVSGFASSIGYTAGGAMKAITFNNGVTETTDYNARQQPWQITAQHTGVLLRYKPLHCPIGTTNDNCATNNGNVVAAQLHVDGTGSEPEWNGDEYFQYDGLNRLVLSVEDPGNSAALICPDAASQWCEQYSYDQYGNRKITSRTVSEVSNWEAGSYDTATNRISNAGWAYDAVGNLKAAASQAMSYDAEGRLVQAGSMQYKYDGEGRRVMKTGSDGKRTVYVYDVLGQVAAEYSEATSNLNCATECYLTPDHLGSTRVVTDQSGNVVERVDYLPFGVAVPVPKAGSRYALNEYVINSGVTARFTGKERETTLENGGLDYFAARYFSGAQGRFISPDAPFADQDEAEPPSWNLYGYARNNPLRYTDPTGRNCIVGPDGKERDDNNGGQSCAEAHEADKNKKPDATVTLPMQELYLMALQGVGENLSSPHQWGTVVSGGAQGAGSILAPLPTAVAQCATGPCEETTVVLAMVPLMGNIKFVKLGGKLLKIDPDTPLRAYLAGARLAKGEGFPEHLIDLTAKELKAALSNGSATPDQVKKISKVVEQGQRLMEKLGGK